MTRVEGVEQSPRLFTAHFPEDDSVRSPTESRLQKIVERDVGLEGICLTFSGQHIRLPNSKLSRILNHHDALMLGDRLSHDLEKRRLPAPGSAANEQCLSAANLSLQKVRKGPRQRAARDEVVDGVSTAGELTDRQCRSRPYNRRNYGRQAASVGQLSVQDWIVLVESLSRAGWQ